MFHADISVAFAADLAHFAGFVVLQLLGPRPFCFRDTNTTTASATLRSKITTRIKFVNRQLRVENFIRVVILDPRTKSDVHAQPENVRLNLD